MRPIFLAFLLCLCPSVHAQDASSALAGSTVSGRVFCNDTNAPARFATVVLEPVSAIDGASDAGGKRATYHMTGGETLPDGSFAIQHVPPGAYYVFVSYPGYVSPLAALGVTQEQLEKPTRELKQEIAQLLPVLTVQPNLPASINVTLLRGAAVAGTVLYDDGSPAPGLAVTVLVQQKDKWVKPESGPVPGVPGVQTDDRGAFRFAGLPPGKYLVQVDLSIQQRSYDVGPYGFGTSFSSEYSIPVYSGDAFRTRDATAFLLQLGDERGGEDIQIPLAKLHSVAGTVTAQHDGHLVNAATISLLHADDRTVEATTELAAGQTGWSLSYVPEGDYLLRVTDARDVQYEVVPNPPGTTPPVTIKSQTLRSYGPVEQPLHVGADLSGVVLAVPTPQSSPPAGGP